MLPGLEKLVDGRIFIHDVNETVRIRTGETGEAALERREQ